MINEHELRIGNYYQASIEFKGSAEATLMLMGESRIFQLIKEKLILSLQLDLIKYFQPITITEVRLLNLGFEKSYDSFYNPEIGLGVKKIWRTFRFNFTRH